MKRYQVEESARIRHRGEDEPVLLKNEAVDAALQARRSGTTTGMGLLTEELRRSPVNVDAAVALWTVAQDLGRHKEAAPAFAV